MCCEKFIIEVKSSKREIGKIALRQIKKQNLIPLVLYGKGTENLFGSVELKEANKLYKAYLHNEIVNLELDSKKYSVLVKEVSKHPLSGNFIHFDLYKINLKEEIEVEVNLNLIGEEQVVKNTGGVVVQSKHQVTIKVLPTEIPDHIDFDISALSEIGSVLKVSDLKNVTKYNILDDLEDVLVSVLEVSSEEEVASAKETLIDKMKAEEAQKQAELAQKDKESKEKKK